ncbi:hypothetical protein GCM10029978_103210 [Actinoallomurus acanthiterrae]
MNHITHEPLALMPRQRGRKKLDRVTGGATGAVQWKRGLHWTSLRPSLARPARSTRTPGADARPVLPLNAYVLSPYGRTALSQPQPGRLSRTGPPQTPRTPGP